MSTFVSALPEAPDGSHYVIANAVDVLRDSS